LLVHVPIRNGVAHTDGSAVVQPAPDDPRLEARHPAIRAALVSRLVETSPAWAPESLAANDRAVQLAAEAGLANPPVLPADQIITLIVEDQTKPPDDPAD
jgi:hypothetical protein